MSEKLLVPTFKLNDGTEIPAIAFGTGSVHKGEDVSGLVDNALQAGFSHIDTSAICKNEEYVGTAIRESGLDRSELYITTKFDGGDIEDELHTSLSKIGVKFVDLYLIHFPQAITNEALEDGWAQFEKLQEDGLTKSIGVSNFQVEHQRVLRVAKVVPTVNQIRFHPYNYASWKELLELSAKNNIVIEAYSSLTPITSMPGGPLDPVLAKLSKRIGGTPTQVIFKWVLAKGAVVVTTSSKRERLDEYLAAPSLPDLTADEIAEIDAAGANPPSALRSWCYRKLRWNRSNLAHSLMLAYRSILTAFIICLLLRIIPLTARTATELVYQAL
ncbi:NADP-dependent oxidoreductase domain-containing protein [Amylostereum chailletii]|nr:NADP-dependent oxidoreductase domain-containing protein [Amylostereum chailletii]